MVSFILKNLHSRNEIHEWKILENEIFSNFLICFLVVPVASNFDFFSLPIFWKVCFEVTENYVWEAW